MARSNILKPGSWSPWSRLSHLYPGQRCQPGSIPDTMQCSVTMQSPEVAGFSDQNQGYWNPAHHHDYLQQSKKHHKLGDMGRQLRVAAYRSDHSRVFYFTSAPQLG